MDPIKEAFTKAKQDIFTLQSEIFSLKQDLLEIKELLMYQQTNHPSLQPTNQHSNQSNISKNPSFQPTPTDNLPLNGLKSHFNSLSTGNDGVPTNQPTNQQTNQHIGNRGVRTLPLENSGDKLTHIDKLASVLNSLDDIKKELRHRFKKLTSQEMSVFSTIYQLEEQGLIVDYSILSNALSISEISIRDYIRKLIAKGAPIRKTKENNKKITLSISPDLKKITTLSTIIQLRDI